MEATELRKKKIELEKEIQRLVVNFITEVGRCEVNINVDNTTSIGSFGSTHLISTNVTIDLTV